MLGDFNAHLPLLEDRREDINGKMVMRWVRKDNLILLNADEMCSGTHTFKNEIGQKSAIGLFLNKWKHKQEK